MTGGDQGEGFFGGPQNDGGLFKPVPGTIIKAEVLSWRAFMLEWKRVTQLMNDNTEQVINVVRDYFAGRPGIAAVYLYGSAVHGPFTPYSDIDVGVLYEREDVPGFEQQIDDSVELSNRLRREVDLIILNNVTPILQRQVLKKGRMILCQNPKAANRFFVNALNSYFDLKQNRREIERNLYQVSIYD